jgi:hypothetical protein
MHMASLLTFSYKQTFKFNKNTPYWPPACGGLPVPHRSRRLSAKCDCCKGYPCRQSRNPQFSCSLNSCFGPGGGGRGQTCTCFCSPTLTMIAAISSVVIPMRAPTRKIVGIATNTATARCSEVLSPERRTPFTFPVSVSDLSEVYMINSSIKFVQNSFTKIIETLR